MLIKAGQIRRKGGFSYMLYPEYRLIKLWDKDNKRTWPYISAFGEFGLFFLTPILWVNNQWQLRHFYVRKLKERE